MVPNKVLPVAQVKMVPIRSFDQWSLSGTAPYNMYIFFSSWRRNVVSFNLVKIKDSVYAPGFTICSFLVSNDQRNMLLIRVCSCLDYLKCILSRIAFEVHFIKDVIWRF